MDDVTFAHIGQNIGNAEIIIIIIIFTVLTFLQIIKQTYYNTSGGRLPEKPPGSLNWPPSVLYHNILIVLWWSLEWERRPTTARPGSGAGLAAVVRADWLQGHATETAKMWRDEGGRERGA